MKKGTFKRTKLNLCDLAGNEKLEKENDMKEKDHLNEMININLSLSTLGKVIHSLVTRQSHIPYRDSKLTRLLQDSLGGNTFCYLIGTISSSSDSYNETVSTLKFSDRAKNVSMKIKHLDNNSNVNNDQIIRKLKSEIESYKNILNLRKKRGNFNELEIEILKLKKENTKLKEYLVSNNEVENLVDENNHLRMEILKYNPGYFEEGTNQESDYVYDRDNKNTYKGDYDNHMDGNYNTNEYENTDNNAYDNPNYHNNNYINSNSNYKPNNNHHDRPNYLYNEKHYRNIKSPNKYPSKKKMIIMGHQDLDQIT